MSSDWAGSPAASGSAAASGGPVDASGQAGPAASATVTEAAAELATASEAVVSEAAVGPVPPLPPSAVRLGIYEKALRQSADWDSFLSQVGLGGFSFLDLSIDESQERMARLDWTSGQRRDFRAAADRQGVQVGGICLSCHRKVGPGSADPAVRRAADDIYRKAIDLAYDLAVPVIQVAGYYAYYEQPNPHQRAWYVESLGRATAYAAQAGVILAIENVDGNDVTSISKGLAICDEIGSPWLQMYPDIGNLAEQELDTLAQLRAGQGRMVALHVKDVRPGQPRRVAMGTGTADFPTAFAELARQRWSGRMMIEMWNDDSPDSVELSAQARGKVEAWLAAAGIEVVPACRE